MAVTKYLTGCHLEEGGFILVCGLKVHPASPGEGLMAGVAPSCAHMSFLTP